MTISYAESFDISSARNDLALDSTLTARLDEALAGPHRNEIRLVIEETITRLIRHHGVDTDTGEWLGYWQAADIISTILTAAAVPAASIQVYLGGALWDLKALFPDMPSYMYDYCLRAAHAVAREMHGVNLSNRRYLSYFPREIWEIFRDNGVDNGCEIRTPSSLSDPLWAAVYSLRDIKWAGDLKAFVCRDAAADWDPIIGGVDRGIVPWMSGVDYDAVQYRLSH